MGSGYNLTCEKCGYQLYAMVGTGMMYPKQCASLLDDMKKGKFGRDFKKDARRTPLAAVYVDHTLFTCSACRALTADIQLELCEPIGKPEPRQTIFSSACPSVPGYDYVMSSDLGKRYRVIRTLLHPCGTCGRLMQPVNFRAPIPCPRCSGTLTRQEDMFWD